MEKHEKISEDKKSRPQKGAALFGILWFRLRYFSGASKFLNTSHIKAHFSIMASSLEHLIVMAMPGWK